MTRHPSLTSRHRAFSLVELLVTIGIIAGLLAIGVPMILKARKTAARARLASDLQAITIALDAYKADFGDYPRVAYDPNFPAAPGGYDVDRPNPPSGAEILCRALVGPSPAIETPTTPAGQIPVQDGNDGPGFRLRAQGTVHGPYLAADKFKMGPVAIPLGSASTPANPATNTFRWVLQDSDGNPILYFPRRTPAPTAAQYLMKANPLTAVAYPTVGTDFTAAEQYAYDIYDNVLYFLHTGETSSDLTNAARRICVLLHDYNPANPTDMTYNFNGQINADKNEGPAVSEPYLLWMAGPDGKFGTDSPTPSAKDISSCDDVTNFNQ